MDINIFRGYDVRGDATATKPEHHLTLREEDACLIGQALVSLYTEKGQVPRVLITSDHRLSSPALKKSLCDGCCAAGAQVDVNEGATPTGATSWYILHKRDHYDVAVQITGSHNPYYQNGLKITCKQNELGESDIHGTPQALYGEKLKQLYFMIQDGKLVKRSGGAVRTIHDVVGAYQEAMIAHFRQILAARGGRFAKPMQVVLDSGNGMGIKALDIFKGLGMEVVTLFPELDGKFPNHPADPSKAEGLEAAQKKVRELNRGDGNWLGIVFDGDGDRGGVIAENGVGIYPEQILVINYTRFLLQNEAGFVLLSELGEHVELALDVRGSGVAADILSCFGKLVALRRCFLEKGVAAEEVAKYYRKALGKIWQEMKIAREDFPAPIFPELSPKEMTEVVKRGCGVIGKYIPAGYPNHRNHVREQIAKLKRLTADKKLSAAEVALLQQMQHQFTSAETSGHFFYATCDEMPEIMVDDGIFAVLELLHTLDTMSDYEVKAGLVRRGYYHLEDHYRLTELFSSVAWRPVSNEVRGGAPEDNAKKFAVVGDITRYIKQEQKNPSKRFHQTIASIIDVDGARAEFGDGSFCLIRASNTSPMLTYKFEAQTQQRLIEIIQETIEVMRGYAEQGFALKELEDELAAQKAKLGVPFLNFRAQYLSIQKELQKAVLDVLESQQFILGATVENFEKACAAYCNTRYAVGVSSGSDALLMAMMASDIKPGDEVITTPFTFFATASTIHRLGAKPVFVDIDQRTYNIRPDLIERAITAKTRAIMPVHLYGQCADMDAILAIARKHNLVVIEDAAQSFGASYRGKMAGAMGEFGCFSFYPTKNLGGIGEGGLITANDEARYHRLLDLRNHGNRHAGSYPIVGGNFRLDALQAAALHVKLPHLAVWNKARVQNAKDYEDLFGKAHLLDKIRLPYIAPECSHIFHQYVIAVEKRDELQQFLKQKGVGTGIYYSMPLYQQPCLAYLGCKSEDFSASNRMAQNGLALPIYPELTMEHKQYVVAMIGEFYQK
jgi:dTDP-4-amino-4,6-dideoxygalactose transaminase/phosphomannomutase